MLTGGKPSGREVKERRTKLELLLKDGFEIEEGAEVKVQTVLAYAGVDDESQRLVTRPLKEIFPGVHKRRENKHLVFPISHDQNFNLSPSLSYGCEMHFTFFWPRVRFV